MLNPGSGFLMLQMTIDFLQIFWLTDQNIQPFTRNQNETNTFPILNRILVSKYGNYQGTGFLKKTILLKNVNFV